MSHDPSALSFTSAAPVGQDAAEGPPPLAVHPNHAHLNSMIDAGIVTHLVTVNEEIDPLFVVAQIRELPEVDFVAAFQNGLIAFGCADRLPDVLAAIAQPAFATAPPPAPVDPMTQRLITLEETIATLLLQSGPDRRIAEIRDEIGSLNVRLAASTSAEQLQNITTTVAAIKEELATPAAPPPDERIDVLQDQVKELSTQQNRGWGADQLREIMSAIAAIRTELTTSPNGEIALSQEASDQGVAVLSMLVKRVEAVAQQVTARAVPEDPSFDLAELQDRVDQLTLSVTRTGKSEQRNSDKTQRMVQELSGALDKQAAAKSDVTDLELKVDQLHRQNADLVDALNTQHRLIKDLANRPEPQIDLSEQRADMARFGAELTAAIDRMEASARQLAAQARMPSPQVEDVLAAIGKVPQATHDALSQTVDLAALDQEVADMRASLATLPERLGMAGIERKVTALSQRSDPVAALSAQNQHFTRFGNSIAGVKERLDAMAQTLSAVRYERAELDNLAETATRIETQMLQISHDQKKAQDGLSEDIRDLNALHFSKPVTQAAKRDADSRFDEMISGRIRSNADALGAGMAKQALGRTDT